MSRETTMHNRVTTVVLSIVAFAATTGLVIAAGGERAGSGGTVERAASGDKGAARPLPGAIGTPWVGVDPDEAKPVMSLKPRTIQPKADRIDRPSNATGSRLVVKFVDEARLRVLPNGSLMSMTGMDVGAINDIVIGNGVILEASSNVPESRIQAIINRAELNSGKAQPDIGGIYYVTGFQRDVDNAADELHRNDLVEWAFFQATDPYTANQVSLAAAPQAAPRREPAPVPNTALLTAVASERSFSNQTDRPELPGLGGARRGDAVFACCVYQQVGGIWELDICTDATEEDCAAAADEEPNPATLTRWEFGRICGAGLPPFNCSEDPDDMPAACCLPDGSCQDLFRLECLAIGTWNTSSESCSDTSCVAATGACCILDNCTVETAADCVTNGGEWQGSGTTCDGDICGAGPFGACCTQDDDEPCVNVIDAFGCDLLNGTFIAGQDCSNQPNPCDFGACCTEEEGCQEVQNLGECLNLGGTWQGLGIFCADIDCPLTACCFEVSPGQNDCVLLETLEECADRDGLWRAGINDCALADCPEGPVEVGVCCFATDDGVPQGIVP
ncbi:MAG: hypothetical protein MK101_12615, partial [Phycisphaerales bacterium]|nr:hypothetical protein [Phycisphaerales bacterium]